MKSTVYLTTYLATALALAGNLAFAQSSPNDGVIIGTILLNEVRIDQPGADNDEYFELSGPPGTSLDGLWYVVIGDGASAQGSGVVEVAVNLTGLSLNANGLFLAVESTYTLSMNADLSTDLNFENSDNVTHLLVESAAPITLIDLDTDDDGVLDIIPWTSVLSGVALIEAVNPPSGAGNEYYYSNLPNVGEVGPDGTFVPGHAFRCEAGWRIGSFDLGSAIETPGAVNFCPALTFSFCTALANSVAPQGSSIALSSASGGSIAANDASLVVSDTPDQFGLFVQSMSSMAPVTLNNGGNLCLGYPDLQRLNPPITASGNTASYTLDFMGAGPESFTLAGTTMYYQWYHRDTQAPLENLSLGFAITWIQ